MHQQIPPLDQSGISSPMAQPIVICPIQLVYDAQRHAPMMVQRNEEQIQIPHPMLLNVQTTPPWIQNPTQNIIYVQQTPNQMLPYLPPNLLQNPIFQTPYNYPQIIPQEHIRPIMQIPTIIQNDTVQNQSSNLNYPMLHENMTQNPMININYNEKMPFVAHNQVNTALKTEMMQLNQLNDMAGSGTMPNQAQNQNIITAKTEMKPNMAQNQVNTISNTETIQIRNKTKNKMPLLAHLLKTPSELEIKPITQNQHVQTDFPIAKSSNNTNTVDNPGLQQIPINNASENNEKTDRIPQLNPMDTRQDHKTSNLRNQRHVRPIRPNITKNSEVPLNIKSNNQDTINVRSIYRPILPKPVVKPNEFKGSNFVNPNFVTLRAPDPVHAMNSPNRGAMTNYTLINEDNNTRRENNNNNKAIEIHNITSMSGGTIIHSNINNNEDLNTQDLRNGKNIENFVADKLIEKTDGKKLNLISIEEILIEEYAIEKYDRPIENKVDKENEMQANLKPIIKSYLNEIQTPIKEKHEKVDQEKEKGEQENEKVDRVEEKVGQETKKQRKLDKNNISILNKDDEKKDIPNHIFILTHVLDGHVIQESNVAFPIHKPLKEKITYEPFESDTPDWKNEVEPLLPLQYLHIIDNKTQEAKDTELKKEDVEGTDVNPFLNLWKSSVEEWNMDELSSHLMKHNWKETATKLREQEIDGESLLLVSEQQLMYIGVNEKHVELITEFINKCN